MKDNEIKDAIGAVILMVGMVAWVAIVFFGVADSILRPLIGG